MLRICLFYLTFLISRKSLALSLEKKALPNRYLVAQCQPAVETP